MNRMIQFLYKPEGETEALLLVSLTCVKFYVYGSALLVEK